MEPPSTRPRTIRPAGDVLAGFRPEAAEPSEQVRPAEAGSGTPAEQITDRPPEVSAPVKAESGESITLPSDVAPRRGLSGVGLYWLVFLALLPIAILTFAAYGGQSLNGSNLTETAIVVLFLGLPVVQLAASIVAAFLSIVLPGDVFEVRLQQIGKITLSSLIGTLLGLGLMALVCLPLLKW